MAVSATRGVLSGIVAGAGAWVAHTLSGGEVTPGAGLAALTLSVALGPLLLAPVRRSSRRDRPVGPLRAATLMLLAQGVWHLVFLSSGDTSHAHGTHAAAGHAAAGHAAAAAGHTATATSDATVQAAALPMLVAHLLVAAVATAAAVGLDRSLVRTLGRLAASLLPRALTPRFHLRTPLTPAPAVTENPVLLETARFLVVRVLRGPPAPAPSAVRG